MKAAKDLAALRAILNGNLLSPYYSMVGEFEIANQDNPKRNDLAFMAEGMSLPEKSYYEEKAPVDDLRGLAKALFQELKNGPRG